MARPSRGSKTSRAKARKARPAKGGKSKTKSKTKRRIAATASRLEPRSVSSPSKDLKEAREQQAATAEILKVIASSPDDVQPVFDAIAASANRLVGGFSTAVHRVIDDIVHLVAFTPTTPEGDEVLESAFPRHRSELAAVTMVQNGEIAQVADAETADPQTQQLGRARGWRSVTFTPLMNQGALIGFIACSRRETGVLADHQVHLLQTFADQAVIAIQNARLFNETKEALEQQTATAEILKVIASSPDNVQPVLEAVSESAMRLLDGWSVLVILFDGEQMHFGAARGSLPDTEQYLRGLYPARPDPETSQGRCILERTAINSADAQAHPSQKVRERARLRGFRSGLVVPMLRDGQPIGAISVARKEAGAFAAHEIELLQTFADQAVIAIENVRLFDEVQAKTRDLEESLQQQTATADVLKVISRSTFDLQTVLETLIKSAVELSGANRGSIFLREGDVFPLRAASSTTPEFLEYWAKNPPRAGRGSTTSRVIESGKVEIISDVLEDPEMQMPAGSLVRIRATLGVPMVRDNRVEGVLVLTRPDPGPFTKSQIDLVQTFADQAVIAVENVRLFEETQTRTRELASSLADLRAAQDRLVQSEKLASLGQLTAGIAHEIKNPLNFVNNFAALSAELTDELNDTLAPEHLSEKARHDVDELTGLLKDNLSKVVQHGKRADSIVKNMLLHSREGSGEHRSADINALVEESLNLAYHGARAEKSGFNITLRRDLAPDAGAAELYPQEITRALLNLISNGFYAATRRKAENGETVFEPTLLATTGNLGSSVQIRIRDNGTGIPSEVKEKMFNPFFTTKPAGEGTGLGLSMTHDIIVKQHGGKIDVETEPGVFTEFIITLPRQAAAHVPPGGKT